MGEVMLQKILTLLKLPIVRIGIGVVFLLIFSGAGYGLWSIQQPPPQPLEFNHSVHIELGVQCLYCHPGAWKQASASLPTSAKCWGCHQQMENSKPAQQVLVSYVQSGEPIPWVPVFIQPDFVYFNHRPHIAAGVNCETCHGEVSRMAVPQPIKGQNMGWCLSCHRERAAGNPELLTRLTDCATCHR